MNECHDCLENFETEILYLNHKDSEIQCRRYRNIMFNCTKCDFSTKGINNIHNHLQFCDKETQIDILNEKIRKYEIQLAMERATTIVYKKIIQHNTSIKVDIENENDINERFNELNAILISLKKLDLPISPTISPNINNTLQIPINNLNGYESCGEETKKKITYKTLKKCIELIDEPTKEEQETKVDEVNKTREQIKKNFKNITDANIVFKNCFTQIQQNRVYTKNLQLIKKTRQEIIGCMNYNEYKSLVEEHKNILLSIFKEKKYIETKINANITKAMSSLDMRIIGFGDYYNVQIDMDDINNLEICLELTTQYPKEYQSFNYTNFTNQFFNYGSVIFTIKQNIERYLFNPYGYNNVVFFPLRQNTENDPFSFYILNKIEKSKRHWNMDCRLEKLSNSFIDDVRPYLIDLFRKLYHDTFKDNDYRLDYSNVNSVTETDLEMLIKNIFLLCDPRKFCNFFRNIIKEKATYEPTENDKINLRGDDILQRDRFKTDKGEIDAIDCVKLLFDTITTEEAVDLYRKKVVLNEQI